MAGVRLFFCFFYCFRCLYYTDEQKDLPINHAAVTLPLSAANVFLHTE